MKATKSQRSQGSGERWVLWLMLCPCLIVLFGVTLIPVIYLFRLSTFHWELAKPYQIDFNGITNYLRMLRDVNFWEALKVSVIMLAETASIQLALGLFIAELLSPKFKGKEVVRTAILFPMVVPPIVAGVIWRILYHPSAGLVNYFLAPLSLAHPWLADSATALFAIVVADTWQWTPFVILMFVAAYAAIPTQLFEAASVDGASRWRRFIHVSLPLITPMIFVAMSFRIIEIIRIFPKIYLLTGGGPGRATETMYFYVYRSAFNYGKIGYSSAVGIFLLFFTFLILGGFLRKT